MKTLVKLALAAQFALFAQPAPSPESDAWKALRFLEGTWDAKTPAGAGPAAMGTYTFAKELRGHILARHSATAACKGPADFDCEHGDLLYIYEDAPGQPIQAIYFDNEGHTIHYRVTSPNPGTAVFLSDASTPGPRFRLVYELKNAVMSGKFQAQMPGKSDWQSYLEWSGGRK